MIIKSSLGLSFGVVFSVLLFKRRAWPAWVGLGFGAGRAWEEADGMFIMPSFHDVKSPKGSLEESNHCLPLLGLHVQLQNCGPFSN